MHIFFCISDVSAMQNGDTSQSIEVTRMQNSRNGGSCFTRPAETNEAAKCKIVDEKCTSFCS
jgi:hypothetical protein